MLPSRNRSPAKIPCKNILCVPGFLLIFTQKISLPSTIFWKIMFLFLPIQRFCDKHSTFPPSPVITLHMNTNPGNPVLLSINMLCLAIFLCLSSSLKFGPSVSKSHVSLLLNKCVSKVCPEPVNHNNGTLSLTTSRMLNTIHIFKKLLKCFLFQ